MRRMISRLLKKWNQLSKGWPYARSYSQYGEDMILRAIFARYPDSYQGFYVDVGAHHPIKLSNTYYFYKRGWHGIAIDPIPGGKAEFRKYRPRDIFIEAGISDSNSEKTYHIYDSSPLNTFSEAVVNERHEEVLKIETVKMLTLRDVLAMHLPPGRIINILSVDVEGYELQVLRSNDWERYRPRVVVLEELSLKEFEKVTSLGIDAFLKSNGYQAIAMTPSGLFYEDTTSSLFDGTGFLKVE